MIIKRDERILDARYLSREGDTGARWWSAMRGRNRLSMFNGSVVASEIALGGRPGQLVFSGSGASPGVYPPGSTLPMLIITFPTSPTFWADNVCLSNAFPHATKQVIEGGVFASVASALFTLPGTSVPVTGGSGTIGTQTQQFGSTCGSWLTTLTGRALRYSVTDNGNGTYEFRMSIGNDSNWRYFHASNVVAGVAKANSNTTIGLDNDPVSGDDTYGTGGTVLLSAST